MQAMGTTVEENRRNHFQRKKNKERHPGYNNMHRRGRDFGQEYVNDWPRVMKLLSNEALGSILNKHMMAGDLSFAQASAGRYYAKLAGEYDKFFGLQKRAVASPSYQSGFGKDDEVTRREQDGTIKEYEHRAKRLRKRWERVHMVIGEIGPTRTVIEKVCIYDVPIVSVDIPALTAGLELLARHFGFNPAGELQDRESHGHRARGR